MWRTIDRFGPVLLVLLAAIGCGEEPDRSSGDDPAQEWKALEAPDFLYSLEEGLLEERPGSIDFDVTAEGAFEANLIGVVQFDPSGEVELEAEGAFGGEPVRLSLSARDGRMRGGSGDEDFDVPVPPELHEALLIGLTRMGILHNLARLVAGAPPDRADGGVRSWVEAREIGWVTENVEAGERGLAFEIWVEGQPAGEATLWLNGEGQPVQRSQVVRFPGGEMVVRELYRVHR